MLIKFRSVRFNIKRACLYIGLGCLTVFCKGPVPEQVNSLAAPGPHILILGTIQDGGSPQAGCEKNCCRALYGKTEERRVVSLGLFDPENNKRFLFEAGPDIGRQLHELNKASKKTYSWPDGIFISHAHIGHYSGLMQLGREAMNAQSAKVYALPRMKRFLEDNGPWSQLCANGNIELRILTPDSTITLGKELRVRTLLVPHRDEFSETGAFIIEGPHKKLLFIPDIDKWQKWDHSLPDMLKGLDYALIDGTFYAEGELPGRKMSEIPHPFVTETMELLKELPPEDRKKIHFIHLNHSNPLLDGSSQAFKAVVEIGLCVARFGQVFPL